MTTAECDWQQEDDENMPGTYRTACGRLWTFTEGGIKENELNYCMGCGKKARDATVEKIDCEECGHSFPATLGKYGCPNCG